MTMMKKGIKNIIFDMGNVIIRFDPDIFMDRAGVEDIDDRKLLKQMIYDSKMWVDMDMGELCEDEMIDIVEKEVPEHLKRYVKDLIKGWCDPVMVNEGVSELIYDLKGKGYGIYLLSNASVMQKEYWVNVECSRCFDGTVVSAYEHLMKPDERIYKLIMDRYDLKADECLFIDDRPVNIEAAKGLGMDTFLFEGDHQALREYIG